MNPMTDSVQALSARPKRVLVLGGGIGGLTTAFSLKKQKPGLDIVVIDREDCFTFTPAIYHTAAGELPESRICVPLAHLLTRRNIRFVHDEITQIDWKNNRVMTKNNESLDYDFGAITLGAQTNYFNLPGMQEHAFALKTKADAERLEAHIEELLRNGQKARILVVGGGLTGVELAGDLCDHMEKKCRQKGFTGQCYTVTLVHGGAHLVPELSDVGGFVEQYLAKRGVLVVLNSRASGIEGNILLTQDKKRIEGDVIVWTGGLKMLDVIANSGLSLVGGDGGGRATAGSGIAVNEFLQIAGQPALFGVGDCISPIDESVRKQTIKTAWNAARQGRLVAENIVAAIDKRAMKKYEPKAHPVAFTIGHDMGVLMVNGHVWKGKWVAWLKDTVEEWYVRRTW